MKVSLNVSDRIMMPQLFPEKSSIINLRLTRDIGEKIKLTDGEKEKFNVRFTSSQVAWDVPNLKDSEIEIEFSNSEIEFLQDRIRDLNKKESLTMSILDLCEKINKLDTKEK